mgnify:CR=1 FL=1
MHMEDAGKRKEWTEERVDFVLAAGKTVVGIEVKSGR